MTAAPQSRAVRDLVLCTFEELGVSLRDPAELNETLLLQNRRFVARSYRAGGLMAMWLVQAGVIQFYDSEGAMLRTVSLFRGLEAQQAAA